MVGGIGNDIGSGVGNDIGNGVGLVNDLGRKCIGSGVGDGDFSSLSYDCDEELIIKD